MSRPSSGVRFRPRSAASTSTKLSPPKAVSTVRVPKPSISNGASNRSAKDGTLVISMLSALPSRQTARTGTSPAGASRKNRVSGSTIGIIPVSRHTVATQMLFDPDIGGVCTGSMIRNPIAARGSFGGTSRFTWVKTPPRGSFSTRSRSVPIRGQPVALLPQGCSGRRRDAAGDHVAHLALGMGRDHLDQDIASALSQLCNLRRNPCVNHLQIFRILLPFRARARVVCRKSQAEAQP